jgi:cellulose synthase/poly-beta-1,6-N-acetylglucosamine synthase-like glycosyltransferase
MIALARGLFGWLVPFEHVMLGYFLVINGTYLALCVIAFFAIRRYLHTVKLVDTTPLFRSGLAPGVAIVCPAYNEHATIIATVHSLLALEYPNLEIVVVNDGSKDRTLEVLRESFALRLAPRAPSGDIPTAPVRAVYRSATRPNLLVVDKENGGKADSVNAGVNLTRNPLVCMIDGDSLLEPDVLLKMVRPFLEDDRTIAAGGVVRIVNDCELRHGRVTNIRLPKSHWVRFQVVEYFRSFLFGRVGWASFNGLLIISGAFGLFLRRALVEVGGLRAGALAEDIEIVMRLHRHYRAKRIPYRIRFVPEPVCWTEAPEQLRSLAGQRNRWQRGLIQTMAWYRDVWFNPRYGAIGLLAVPFYLLFEMLSPLFEFGGYLIVLLALALRAIDVPFALLFFTTAMLLGVILSLSSLLLEGMTFRRYPKLSAAAILVVYGIVENFGFRQMHTWWRLCGLIDYARGKRGWGTMQRRGFGGTPASRPAASNEDDTRSRAA